MMVIEMVVVVEMLTLVIGEMEVVMFVVMEAMAVPLKEVMVTVEEIAVAV